MTDIPVSGRVVSWAREFRGLSREEAAGKLGMSVDELEEIETEASQPSLTKFEKMASVYRLPLATLFRQTPPKTPPELTDFRTFEGAPPQTSFDFRVALSNVRSLQATLEILKTEDQQFLGAQLRQYDLKDDPFQTGENERTAIRVSVAQQLAWGSGEGFRRWRAVIESLGISVYLQKFKLADCRGCAILDDNNIPAIVINKSDSSENARTFTLIHEYAHLLIRRPGISDLNRKNPVETWCNRFAAAFLMPVLALRRVLPSWPPHPFDWSDETIQNAARELNVSAQALAIRLEELGKARKGLNQRFNFPAVPKKAEKVSYVTKRLSELGGRYTASVIEALDREIIDNVRASEALTLKPAKLEDARLYVLRQRGLASGG
jgi:Zn-dependent peptidase ImmA (M78 family)/DNA-binding XRE family transcriptional regulator